MPSVIVHWSGQLRDVAKREELLLRMADLARLSQDFFPKPRPAIRKFDETLTGEVLLCSEIFAVPPSSAKLTRIADGLYGVRRLALTGLEFGLYDRRRLYPGDDRMSFAFTVDDDPELDGLLVYVDDQEECLKYNDPRIHRANFFLADPHVHLRYYLEEWTDLLMGWLKHHYLPGLAYWRGCTRWTNPTALHETFTPFGKGEYFERLKKGFEGEVRQWGGRGEEAV